MKHKSVQHSKDFYPTLHDPLAVLYAVLNDYVKVEKQLIKVETKGEYTNGETVNIDYLYHYEPTLRPGNRINTAYEVDEQRFLNDYINIYKKEF